MRWSIGLFIAVLCIACISPLRNIWERKLWLDQYTAISDLLQNLDSNVPQNCDPAVWSMAVDRTAIAYWNICVTAEDISTAQLKQMKLEFIEMIATTPPSADLLRQIYERFGEASAGTARKCDKWREDFEETIERVDIEFRRHMRNDMGSIPWESSSELIQVALSSGYQIHCGQRQAGGLLQPKCSLKL
jgi:hypothetical protein